MTRNEMRAELDLLLGVGLEALRQRRQIQPMFVFVKDEQRELVIAPWTNDNEKYAAAAVMTEKCLTGRWEALLQLGDIWKVSKKPGPGESMEDLLAAEHLRPSLDPHRTEALLVTCYTKGDALALEQDYTHEKGKLVLIGEPQTTQTYSAIFDPWHERRSRPRAA